MYNIGFVGYGGMAYYHHTTLSKGNPDVCMYGAYDIDPKRMEVAKENGVKKTYSSLDEILNDSDIDIILVAVPNNFHKEISIAAMEKGKHVICEKPVAMNSEELEEMIAASKKYNRVFSVHQNRRVDKDYLAIKKLYDEKTLGDIFTIESRVHGSRGIPQGWRQHSVAGGGMMLDWGVHLIDQMVMMIKEPVISVYSIHKNLAYPDTDAYFKTILGFANGIFAQIEVSTSTFIALPRWHMSGTKGTCQIENWNLDGKTICAEDMVVNWTEEIVQTKAGPTKTMAPRPSGTVKEYPIEDIENDYGQYYTNFARAIEGKEEIRVKPDEVRRVMKIMETAFLSNEKNEVIKVNI